MNISTQLRNAYDNLTLYVRVRHRLEDSKKDFAQKDQTILKGLTSAQKKEVNEFWHRYGVTSFDIRWVDFYSSLYGTYDKRFIPDDIYFSKIDLYFNNADAAQYLDDKNQYSLLFKGVKMPRTVVRKIKGLFLDEDYQLLTFDEALHLCMEAKNIIFKRSVLSCGGYGIHFWNEKDGLEALKKRLKSSHDFISQEVVRQHPTLNKLHKDSLNSVRIMTLVFGNQVYALSGILRMGINGNKVDNVGSGGICCGIDHQGRLKKYAFQKNGTKLTKHPQGATFSDITIPNYAECVTLAKSLALRLVRCSQLVSWDIAIDEEGTPVLIEANLATGELDFHQWSNGPIFGDLTENVLDEVFHHNS